MLQILMLSILIELIPVILKVLGFTEYAADMIAKRELAKRAQDFANMPTTKQERTDAANNGDL